MRENASGADNQQERLHVGEESSETIRQTPFAERQNIKAYLFGAMHDGTIRHHDRRYRIAQKGTGWLIAIQKMLKNVGYNSWIYKEGKDRDVFVLESVAPIFREAFDPNSLSTIDEKRAYLRGFFDAEGGTPQSSTSTKYVQLAQKDYEKIKLLKVMLTELGIATGKIHNPSKRVDPLYWRIYVSRGSILRFVFQIGSLHPRKRAIFDEWMKI